MDLIFKKLMKPNKPKILTLGPRCVSIDCVVVLDLPEGEEKIQGIASNGCQKVLS